MYSGGDQPVAVVGGRSSLLYGAIFCGAFPLALGSLIYWTWRVTNWEWLPEAGLLTVFGGLLLFFVGACLLLSYWHAESRSPGPRRFSISLQVALVAGLLFVNFPAAAFYASSALDLMERYTILIANDSGAVVDSFVLEGPGVAVEAGPISAGDYAVQHLYFKGDGNLTFFARQKDVQISGEIEGYVTGGLGGGATLQIKPDGKYELQREVY